MSNRPSYPLMVTINITGVCNLSCSYCYFQPRNQINMTLTNFKKTIEILKASKVFLVTLSGGEPFLHPQINQMLRLAHEYFLHVSILSNGTAISEQHLETISNIVKTKGVFPIQISLDSLDAHINNETRGMASVVLENIARLKQNGATITIAIVITSQNIDKVTYTIKNLMEVTRHFHVMPFRPVPYLKGTDSYLNVSPDKIRLVWEELIDLRNEYNLQVRTPLDDICNGIKTSAKGAPCMAGFTKLTIDPNLDVRPCDKCVETTVGNLETSSLKEIWEGPSLANVYQREVIFCANGNGSN